MPPAVKPTDPLTVYTDLTTNLPQWITEIHTLAEYVSQKHLFFMAEYTRLLADAHSKPKRLKSPSISSIHPSENTLSAPQPPQAPLETDGNEALKPNPTEISPFEPGNKYLYAQARRKRKTDSSLPSGASGPQKFRNKQRVIIYYDSQVQDQLDGMVRKISTARNELRKAKATAAARRGFQLPKINRRHDIPFSPPNRDTKSSVSLSTNSDTRTELPMPEVGMDPLAESTFASADKGLDAAQTLCETAAHQFLRDGDCRIELETAPKKLDAVLEVAKVAAQKLQQTLELEEKKKVEEQKLGSEETEPTLLTSTQREDLSNKLTPILSNQKIDISHPLGLGTMEIEVDDSDDSDASTLEVDIRNFRLARSNRVRL